jgi:hypothetical protein
MPTIQGTSNFPGFRVPTDFDAVNGSLEAILDPRYQGLPNTLKVVANGSTTSVQKNLTGSPTRAWMGVALRRDTVPTGGGLLAAEFHNAGGGSRGQMRWTAAGALVSSIQSETTSGTPFTTAAGQFYWVEMIYECAAPTYNLFWRVNGVDQVGSQRTGAAGTTLDFVDVGSDSGDTGLTFYAGGYWAWGTAVSSSDWLGERVFPQPLYWTRAKARRGRRFATLAK